MEDAAYHLAASSQSVRHSVRRAIHRRHQLRSFNRPQHTKFLTRPQVAANSCHWWRNSGKLLNSVLTLAYFDRLGVPRLS
ncbi:hypothetical protein A8F72_20360 [Burkholderia cenocepacia]|nr:hypothetical protein A8F36_22950 [Burkholderia cenocepacia]ONY77299.1 hypothetical protein A8F35_09615 [Burkholderia cenocepacia]ONY96297.1 hypothetical protein A8F34_24775 [Burkholderia cenocepacia]OOA16974.1 hypothetical protein A8F55_08655 [Burkholderia cenocepacia]OOA20686.1 hypothetical protein A8F58_26895 [Burkholderia cenocepacia]